MVTGLELFRNRFKDYSDQYIVIGGMACDILMEDAGLVFRLTKDVDMVLIVEALTNDFAHVFWSFIEDGGYTARKRKTGKAEFYRFVEPKSENYPSMIELFARPENAVDFEYKGHLVPIHLGDDLSSLSAILLNDDYYRFILSGCTVIDNITILDAAHIVPLKMKAWLDLRNEKAEGKHVNSRDLRKHRQDVFRLFPVVNTSEPIATGETILSDITAFLSEMRNTEIDLKAIGITLEKDLMINEYEKLYCQ